jgi:hypothetical protein
VPTSRTESSRLVEIRKATMNAPALIATDAANTTTLRPTPKAPEPLPANPDSTVVPNSAAPTVPSSSRLRPRAANGLGRLLRGTAHTVFIAFCND